MMFMYYTRAKMKEGRTLGHFRDCNKTKDLFVQVAWPVRRRQENLLWPEHTIVQGAGGAGGRGAKVALGTVGPGVSANMKTLTGQSP